MSENLMPAVSVVVGDEADGVNMVSGVTEIAAAFLRAVVTPAFLWDMANGKLLTLNPLAEKLFKRFQGDSDFIGDSVRNWTKVRTYAYHTMWFEFAGREEHPILIQIRNTIVDEKTNLIISVVVNSQWAGSSSTDASFDSLAGLIRSSSVAFLSRKDFIEQFETLINRATIALNVSSLSFYPSERLQSFGLYETAEKIAKANAAFRVYEPILKDMGRFKPGVIGKLRDLSNQIPDAYRAYVVSDGGGIVGWFVLVLYDNREYSTELMTTVFDVFSTFFQSLVDKIVMTKTLYQSDLENRLNVRIVDNVSEGVLIVNRDFQIVYLNKIAIKMFGFMPSELFGHQLEDLLVSSVSIRETVMASDEEDESFVETPSVQYLHRRSGERFPCQIRFSRVRLTSDTRYTVFVLNDVTEAEESQRKTDQLTQRAILGDFSSMMAHEIRNPINNINTWVQYIKSHSEKNDAIYNAAQRIDDDCQRVSELIKNILSFSKPLALTFEPTDFVALIEIILDRWKRQFATEQIQLFFRASENFPKLMLNVRSIDQVLTNLIQNAVDAIDHGGGIISLSLSVQSSNIPNQNVAVLTVSNSGPGIPEEVIDRIFEPFFTSKKNGNGWGLALSKRIITSHKGTIQVKSLSEGVVFEIQLPIPGEVK